MKLWTKVEKPVDRRVLVPYTKATEKVQAVIDCLRIQYVQPEAVKVDTGDAYWKMLRDAWSDGREFMVVEHDVMVWPGSVAFLFSCDMDWCVLPTLCHGRMYTTSLGAMRFGATMIQRNPGLWDRISSEWMYLDAHLSEEMGWPFITPHAHYPAAAHLNESQWPNDISMREIERRVGWHVQESGGDPVAWMGDHKEETWQTS